MHTKGKHLNGKHVKFSVVRSLVFSLSSLRTSAFSPNLFFLMGKKVVFLNGILFHNKNT